MSDLIARCLAHLLSLLFPAHGKHRPTAATPEPAPAPPARTARRPLRPLPEHKSPYAHAVGRPFLDTIPPVRPYVLAPAQRPAPTEKEAAQGYRRWVEDMADRGLHVGPTTLHGVHLLPGSRTIHIGTAA